LFSFGEIHHLICSKVDRLTAFKLACKAGHLEMVKKMCKILIQLESRLAKQSININKAWRLHFFIFFEEVQCGFCNSTFKVDRFFLVNKCFLRSGK